MKIFCGNKRVCKQGGVICILIILLGCLRTAAQPVHLLHKPYSNKFIYIDSLNDKRTDRAQFEKFARDAKTQADWALKNGDEELAGMLLLFEYKTEAAIRHLKADRIYEHGLNSLLEEYGGTSKYLKAEILQALAESYLYYYNKNSTAFEYYLTAYNIYRNFSQHDFPEKQEYVYSLGMSYYNYGDIQNTIKYLNIAIGYSAGADQRKGHDLTISMYNTLGMCYQSMQQYDSALLYFN